MLPRAIGGAAVAVLIGCGSAPIREARGPSQEDEQGIAKSRAALSAALVEADASAAGGVFAADAVLMNPNNPDVRGRETIEARFRGLKKGVIRTLEFTPVEVEVYGDRAYDLSVFFEVLEIPGKPTIEDRGRAMFVWQREPDGAWRIRRMLVNGTLPKGQGVH